MLCMGTRGMGARAQVRRCTPDRAVVVSKGVSVNPSVAFARRAAILGALALIFACSPALAPMPALALPASSHAQADSTSPPPAPPPPQADTAATPPAPPAPDTTAKPSGAGVAPTSAPTPQSGGAAPGAAPATTSKAGAAATAKAAKPRKPPKPPKPPGPSYEQRRSEDGVYAAGANWLSFRFGYAKRLEDNSGNGLVGYGIGYQRMLSKRWAFAVGAGHDVVGRYGTQLDEAVPFAGEFQRHFQWKSAIKPYVGLGGGYYIRKAYRTGDEYQSHTAGGGHLSLGFVSPTTDRHVVGLDMRIAFVEGQPDVYNPTFGQGVGTETLWTMKVSWALVY